MVKLLVPVSGAGAAGPRLKQCSMWSPAPAASRAAGIRLSSIRASVPNRPAGGLHREAPAMPIDAIRQARGGMHGANESF